MKYACLVSLLLLPLMLAAQSTIPAGTVLPLSLETGLKSRSVKPGKIIRAKVMQNIPGTNIHRGARVLGTVVSVTPTRMELRFDTLVVHDTRIPFASNLRAIASMMEVEFAQIPEGGADRGLPPYDKTTQQIGGEQVYRQGGPVTRNSITVAEPTPYGVVGKLESNPPCRADAAENDHPQALWLFSTNACGAYGFSDLSIEHSGRTHPVGTIVLATRKSKLNIRSGSGLLLRVQGT